jgi:O-methyltransferase
MPKGSKVFGQILKSFSRSEISSPAKSRWENYENPGYPHHQIETWATYAPWVNDNSFQELTQKVAEFTLVDQNRLWELWTLARQSSQIEGDFLEVGVWRGGSGALLCKAIEGTTKKVFLADTFDGVVKAGVQDTRYKGGEHADTSLSLVQELLSDLKISNAVTLKGIFPEDTGFEISKALAFVHIDVDVYQSAKEIVSFVLPLLSPNGIVVFDDYGFFGCEGVTRLVNELKDEEIWTFIHNLNGHAILVKRG